MQLIGVPVSTETSPVCTASECFGMPFDAHDCERREHAYNAGNQFRKGILPSCQKAFWSHLHAGGHWFESSAPARLARAGDCESRGREPGARRSLLDVVVQLRWHGLFQDLQLLPYLMWPRDHLMENIGNL